MLTTETGPKDLWFELADETNVPVVEKVCNLDYSTLFGSLKSLLSLDRHILPQRMKLSILVRSAQEVQQLRDTPELWDKAQYVFVEDTGRLPLLKECPEKQTGLLLAVDDRAGLDRAVAVVRLVDVLAIRFKDPTNIPLELVLATSQSSKTRIFKRVQTAADGEVSYLTMEKGSDGILLASHDVEEIVRLSQSYGQSQMVAHALSPAVVTAVKHCGMGDRVCIDTTSALTPDEGMLLGSTSSGGLLVCSETHYLPYMNLRPFRVNAGALHLYVWGPNNKALYLSDLRAGDQIVVFDSKGHGRTVSIGRLKIERRPLLLIEARIDEQPVNVFIQDDWHVRVFGASGEIRPSSEIRPGDPLLGYKDEPGRHVGLKISETIREL
jgi:3-amino-4-hydroxybenzoic acid synthase